MSAAKEYSQEEGGRGVTSPAMNLMTEVEWGAVVPKNGYTYLMYLLPLLSEVRFSLDLEYDVLVTIVC